MTCTMRPYLSELNAQLSDIDATSEEIMAEPTLSSINDLRFERLTQVSDRLQRYPKRRV